MKSNSSTARNLLQSDEYGLASSAVSFMGLLGLPLAIATAAVTHYVARFNFSGDNARRQNKLVQAMLI